MWFYKKIFYNLHEISNWSMCYNDTFVTHLSSKSVFELWNIERIYVNLLKISRHFTVVFHDFLGNYIIRFPLLIPQSTICVQLLIYMLSIWDISEYLFLLPQKINIDFSKKKKIYRIITIYCTSYRLLIDAKPYCHEW